MTMEEARGRRWYALYTKHHHEKKAADILARKGIDTFLPLNRSLRQWKDRRKTVAMPLFPGYVFLRSDLSNRLEILNTPGVFFIVESAGHACPVPEQEIEAVRAAAESGFKLEPHPYLESGERVRIRSGPLAGISGLVVESRNQHRVVISVELLRKAVAVAVDLENLEKISPERPARSR